MLTSLPLINTSLTPLPVIGRKKALPLGRNMFSTSLPLVRRNTSLTSLPLINTLWRHFRWPAELRLLRHFRYWGHALPLLSLLYSFFFSLFSAIYNAELLLAGVLEQRLDFSLYPWQRPALKWWTRAAYVFDFTSVGQRSPPWTCKLSESRYEFHLEWKHWFPRAQLMLVQMHSTNVSRPSIEFLG